MDKHVSKRKLKVCYAFRSKAKRKHPKINLGGHYLSKFGFDIGDYVELIIEKDTIVITKQNSKPCTR